jgi:hypothetical protein
MPVPANLRFHWFWLRRHSENFCLLCRQRDMTVLRVTLYQLSIGHSIWQSVIWYCWSWQNWKIASFHSLTINHFKFADLMKCSQLLMLGLPLSVTSSMSNNGVGHLKVAGRRTLDYNCAFIHIPTRSPPTFQHLQTSAFLQMLPMALILYVLHWQFFGLINAIGQAWKCLSLQSFQWRW